MKRRVIFGGAVLAFTMFASTAAHAATFTVSDPRPVPGQAFIVSGGGCKGGVRVTITWRGDTYIATARDNGTFDQELHVPRDAEYGQTYYVYGRCWNGTTRRYFKSAVTIQHELSAPNQVRRGQLIRVSGSGCAPNVTVVVSFRGYDIGEGQSNGEGEYSITVRIPPRATLGEATIAARCNQVYPPGSRHVDRKVVDVVA